MSTQSRIYSKESLIIALFISIVSIIVIMVTDNEETYPFGTYKDFKSSRINGVIYKKGYLKEFHYVPIVYYVNNDENKIKNLTGFISTSFFKFVTKGDTITKEIRSNSVLIKNKDKIKKFAF